MSAFSVPPYFCILCPPPYILAHISLWGVKLNCSDQVPTLCTAWR